MNQLAAAKSFLGSSKTDELVQRTQQYHDGQVRDRYREYLEKDDTLTPEDRATMLQELTELQLEMRDRRRRILAGEDLDMLPPGTIARPLLTPEDEYRSNLPSWRRVLRAAFKTPLPDHNNLPAEMPPLESYIPSNKEVIKSRLMCGGLPIPAKGSPGRLAIEKFKLAPFHDQNLDDYMANNPEKFTEEDIASEMQYRKDRDNRIEQKLDMFKQRWQLDVKMRKSEREMEAFVTRQASEFMANLPEAKMNGPSRAGRYIEAFMRRGLYGEPTFRAMTDHLRNKRLRLSADPRASTLKGRGRPGFILVGMAAPACIVIILSYAYDRVTTAH